MKVEGLEPSASGLKVHCSSIALKHYPNHFTLFETILFAGFYRLAVNSPNLSLIF
jgi:hypothetical protein